MDRLAFFWSLLLLSLVLVTNQYNFRRRNTTILYHSTSKSQFLVSEQFCKIPSLPVWNSDVRLYYRKMPQHQCNSSQWKWTVLGQDINGDYEIRIIDNPKKNFSGNFFCAYASITRQPNGIKFDDHYKTSAYTIFNKSVVLPKKIEFVIVKCFTKTNGTEKIFYMNAHAMIPIKPHVKARIKKNASLKDTPQYSVIILGIDSLSRLNLYRNMPKTVRHLKLNNWIEFYGYNKVAVNTYPNLIPLLSGYNVQDIRKFCRPEDGLERCPLLFKTFAKAGYVTNYAEDGPETSTFNYDKNRGFKKQPTDYYMRPFLQACEHYLKNYAIQSVFYCLGSTSTTNRVMSYANEFFKQYKNDPKFGLFWLNNFSHQDFKQPQMSDTDFHNWLIEFKSSEIYDNAIVFLMGDHGFQHGPFMKTNTGWLEDRLPMLYVHLPHSFSSFFPQETSNLLSNQRRLVTVYDLYFTFLDILKKSGRNTPTKFGVFSCHDCHSLFQPISRNRSCRSVPIDKTWCTCNACDEFKKKPTLKNLGKYCSNISL